ncbi:MFS transporter [Streptomyces liliifuscus]|uniref:MFS transporter n=1 Tax=Streptomyces liliifuscus TaxID=2797636 RepID=A0A7T7HZT9_9ACTN|nr:MFS transporter [Streptomyces liliifuscus]QQM38399.1 MFS transporter [Streptomyces liliifuscus]
MAIGRGVGLLCALLVLVQSYDLIVYSTLLGSLLGEPGWRLDAVTAGAAGSTVYVGVLAGGMFSGALLDRFGLRPVVLVQVAWSSVWTAACALAADPVQLANFRGLAGLGLGAVVPCVLTACRQSMPPGRAKRVTGVSLALMPPGGGISAMVLAPMVLPAYSWRAMFAVGSALGVLVLAVAARWLPEFPPARERADGTARPGARSVASGAPFRRGLMAGLLGAVVAAVNLLTWRILDGGAGAAALGPLRGLSSDLQFNLTLNTGAVVGACVVAAVALRRGSNRRTVLGCAIGGLGFVVLMPGTFGVAVGVLVMLFGPVGSGLQGALNLVNTWVADTFNRSVGSAEEPPKLTPGRRNRPSPGRRHRAGRRAKPAAPAATTDAPAPEPSPGTQTAWAQPPVPGPVAPASADDAVEAHLPGGYPVPQPRDVRFDSSAAGRHRRRG